MLNNRKNQAIHRLRQLSRGEVRPSQPESPRGPRVAPCRKPQSRGFFNRDHYFHQTRKRGDVESEVYESDQERYRDVEIHRDQVATESEKYRTEFSRALVEEHVERQAQAVLRSSEVWSALQASNAMECVSAHFQAKLDYLRASISDEGFRQKHEAELRLVHARCLTYVRHEVYGPKFDPDDLSPQEFT